MRANARNNLTYVKRDPWYAYEPLWNFVRFAGHRAAVQAKLSRFRAIDQNRSRFAPAGSIVVQVDLKKKIWRCTYILTTLSCCLPAVFLSGDMLILPASLVARVCGDVEHRQRRPAKNMRHDKSIEQETVH
jgi:hypothetical protein